MLDTLFENEFFWVVILALYAFGVILFTKYIYDYLVKKRVRKSVAVYYNRKIIHIFAGGVVVLAVPFVFDSPWYPILAGILLAIFMYLLHLSDRILYWFQTKDDFNDVSFCFMWAIAIFILWTVLEGTRAPQAAGKIDTYINVLPDFNLPMILSETNPIIISTDNNTDTIELIRRIVEKKYISKNALYFIFNPDFEMINIKQSKKKPSA